VAANVRLVPAVPITFRSPYGDLDSVREIDYIWPTSQLDAWTERTVDSRRENGDGRGGDFDRHFLLK